MIGTRMFGHARGDEARKRWPVDFALGVLVAKFNIYIYICIVLYHIVSTYVTMWQSQSKVVDSEIV